MARGLTDELDADLAELLDAADTAAALARALEAIPDHCHPGSLTVAVQRQLTVDGATPSQRAVLTAVLTILDGFGRQSAAISREVIAALSGTSAGHVSHRAAELEDLGYLRRHTGRRQGPGGRRQYSTRYERGPKLAPRAVRARGEAQAHPEPPRAVRARGEVEPPRAVRARGEVEPPRAVRARGPRAVRARDRDEETSLMHERRCETCSDPLDARQPDTDRWCKTCARAYMARTATRRPSMSDDDDRYDLRQRVETWKPCGCPPAGHVDGCAHASDADDDGRGRDPDDGRGRDPDDGRGRDPDDGRGRDPDDGPAVIDPLEAVRRMRDARRERPL
jgi:hypothetical protein